jgi:hypothetical protein
MRLGPSPQEDPDVHHDRRFLPLHDIEEQPSAQEGELPVPRPPRDTTLVSVSSVKVVPPGGRKHVSRKPPTPGKIGDPARPRTACFVTATRSVLPRSSDWLLFDFGRSPQPLTGERHNSIMAGCWHDAERRRWPGLEITYLAIGGAENIGRFSKSGMRASTCWQKYRLDWPAWSTVR